MLKHLPYLYFHTSEGYFPTKIESFGIDWSKVTLNDSSATVDTNNYKGNTSLDQSVPVYTSILQNSDGTTRISYLFLYAWNDKGPKGHIKAKFVGLGIDKSWTWGDYGLGLHYSDVEHIEVYLTSSGNVEKVIYAYHSDTKTVYYRVNGIQLITSTHPTVYVAKGSHGSYTSADTQDYLTVWDESKKVLGVTAYDTYLKFQDFTNSNTNVWKSTNPRLLKLNGNQVSGISNDELYLGFKYSGRLGVRYTNSKWEDLSTYTGITTVIKYVRKVSSSAANYIQGKWNDLRDSMEAECEASNSFYGRSFW
jgi:hypothetical protein